MISTRINDAKYSLASAILMAVEQVPHFTDLIIHEGAPIFIKSNAGTVALSKLLNDGDEPHITTLEDIKGYFANYASGIHDRADSVDFWEKLVEPSFKKQTSVNRTIELSNGVYLRFNIFQFERNKVGVVVRVTRPPKDVLDGSIPEELIKRINDGQKGLLILTGPTASGKTATALSLLKHLSKRVSGHIVSIEDPIEFRMTGGECVFTQREVGIDIADFGMGLREALRQSPDILLVGEVRDRETAETAILAGESGALVIITTHGDTITGALRKLCYLVGEQSASAMRSVLAGCLIGALRQQLVPLGDGYSLVSDYINGKDAYIQGIIEAGQWDAMDTLFSENRSDSHRSMSVDMIPLVRGGFITLETAMRNSSYPRAFAKLWGMGK